MRLTIDAAPLHDALKRSAYARGATTIPQLASVLLKPAGDGGIAVDATNLEARTRIVVDGEAAGFDGVLVDAAKLAAVAAGGGRLAIDAQGRTTRGRSQYALPALPAHEFPDAEHVEWVDCGLHAADLADAIGQIEYAANPNDVRPTCRCVVVANGVIAATNGHVVASVKTGYDGPVIMLPVAQLAHLRGLLHEHCTLSLGNVHGGGGGIAGVLRAEAGNTTVSVTLLSDQPLDLAQFHDRLYPDNPQVKLHRKPLLAAARAFAPFIVGSKRNLGGVALVAEQGSLWLADGAHDGANREDVSEALAEPPTGDFLVWLAHEYLTGVLGAIDTDLVAWQAHATAYNSFRPVDRQRDPACHVMAPQRR